MEQTISLWLRLAAKVAVGAAQAGYTINIELLQGSNSIHWQLYDETTRLLQQGEVDIGVWEAELGIVLYEERTRP